MKNRILIVEDNVALSQVQKDWLQRDGYEVMTAMDEQVARRLIKKTEFDLILSDVRLPEGDGISLLEWLNKEKRNIPFVIMTEYASYADAVRAIKLGAKDYLPKPVFSDRLVELAKELLAPVSTVRRKEQELFKRISPMAKEAQQLAELVAPSDISVMILGSNGTGKESIARTIHFNSNRSGKPFIAVNCGAVPRELASSLFFGYEKGAFTGADTAKGGYFDAAQGGTLFLDEVGTLPLEVQSALLRVLQEDIYMPVGGTREKYADVRIVAATNENMEDAIKNSCFREDLYHRLNEFEIRQPDLKECPEDIMPMAEFFREKFAVELHKEVEGFSKEAERLLLTYSWPGNIRELQNKIRRAVLIATKPLIGKEDLNIKSTLPVIIQPAPLVPLKDSEQEKQSIVQALAACNGNRTKAAELLNISAATLFRKLNKYGIK